MTQAAAVPAEPREFPRRYVAADAEFGSWPAAESYYRELLERPVETREQFERWILDFCELDAAFDEEGKRRRILMTRQTDDPVREQRFLEFIENVEPHREPLHHELRIKLDRCFQRFELPARRYEVIRRSVRNAIALFREQNIPLMVENAKLSQQYQKLTGAMTVTYRGQELTLQQLARFLEEPDRAVREETYRLGAERFLRDGAALDALYDQMVRLRHQIARNADCPDFREYAFRSMERFDYTPADCLAFHDAIEQVCAPAVRRLADERRRKLGLASLRPWDMAVDPENRPPLRPFASEQELMDGCARIFEKVSGDLARVFGVLRRRDLLDLGSRKGKAPGGYMESLDEDRVPFIFMNAVGTESDVRTLLHESGHAFHTWSCRNEPLLPYRHYPIEFAEVASMGMEMLSLPHLEEFYGSETNRARRRFLEGIVTFFPYMARVDALQHWVYTHVDATPEQRNDQWQALTRRFSPEVDWSGIEHFDRRSWHRKLHLFEVPFYYVEYGIAQLGALQVWLNSRKDYEQAVAMYRYALTLGGSRPIPELFEAAGCKFDFSEKTLRPLIEAVMDEIERL